MENKAPGEPDHPSLGYLVDCKRIVQGQAGEHIGDLVRKDGGGMQSHTAVQPAVQMRSGCLLAFVGHRQGEDHACVYNDTHWFGSSAMRASATMATASAPSPRRDRRPSGSSAA